MMFTLAAGLIALLFNPEARAPRITRAEDSGKTIKLIKNGSVVSFEYTIFDENGKVIDSSRGKEPLTYTHGQQQIIPGLEKKLSGMEINEEKNVRLPPEEAFGPVGENFELWC